MADTTLTADIITKAALAVLENELGVLSTLYRAPESEFSMKVNGYAVGETVSIRRPADFTVRSGAVADVQDVIEGKVALTVDQQKGVDFDFTSSDLTLKVEDFSERILVPAMSSLVNDVAADVFSVMYKGLYNWAGTAGQDINSFSDFAEGPKRLDLMAVPQPMRQASLHPQDHWELVGSQSGLFVSDVARPALRQGNIGRLGNIDTWMSQVLPTHTTGTFTTSSTPLVNGASQNVTYDTAKDTWTQSLITDGWANSTAVITAGDVFTLADVFMVNPKTKASTGILQQFVATAAGTSDGSGDLTLTISPPMIASGPHQTVSAAAANNAAIVPVGTEATAYRQNMMYHKNTMALAIVPMELPSGAVNPQRQSRNGISIRIIPSYDAINDVNLWRLDLLYGRKMVDPRLGTRVSGTA